MVDRRKLDFFLKTSLFGTEAIAYDLALIQRAVLKDWKARLWSFLTLEIIYDLTNYF
jgi:hypothetical protein